MNDPNKPVYKLIENPQVSMFHRPHFKKSNY